MESRTRKLARLTRLLDQRKTLLEARRAMLEADARRIEDERWLLLQTVDVGIAAHGLFVDLLAGRMKRLDIEASRIEREASANALQVREDARRVRLVERLQADAVRDESREREKRDLAELIDTAPTASTASLPKG